MKLSVIIPTYNRAEILRKCLEKLLNQKGVDFEVIVVDDGSTDNTREVVESFLGQNTLHYIYQKNALQGVARNNGFKKATGDIILFIGDDIFPQSGFLKAHHDAHVKNSDESIVVLGHSTWDPDCNINDYMRFLESSGWQFAYNRLTPGIVSDPKPYKFFYTSNISLKKSLFQKESFDENFKVYGWEDIEYGYRLWKKYKMKLFYEPKAKGLHHQHIPEADLPKKMQKIGQSAVVFKKLQPEVDIMPTGLKALLIRLATNPLTLPLTRLFGKNTYYKFKSWSEFFKGTKDQIA